MNERKIESLFLDLEYDDENPLIGKIARAASFEDAGILTRNRGVVLRMADGSEFQITIVQSAPARGADNEEGEE